MGGGKTFKSTSVTQQLAVYFNGIWDSQPASDIVNLEALESY